MAGRQSPARTGTRAGTAAARGTITIVGTGLSVDDMSARALRAVEAADILVGGRRQLAFFGEHPAEKIEIGRNAAGRVAGLKPRLRGKKTVVLASGDPNFFGIAALFYEAFDRHRLSVIPNATAFQWAFARIKVPWDRAVFISIHGRDIGMLDRVMESEGLFVIYCDARNTPAQAACYLTDADRGLGSCRAWVCDGLGTKNETIKTGLLRRFRTGSSSPLSMMIIKREKAGERPCLGIPDDMFRHRGGMITRRDVRIIALSRLNIAPGSVLWDIGAGCGSLSIEAACLYPTLRAYAVEEQGSRLKELQKNIRTFDVSNVRAVHGSAPDALSGLPSPDGVFIGGSGGRLVSIIGRVLRCIRANGHIVVNCVTLETLSSAVAVFKKARIGYTVTQVQLSGLDTDRPPAIFRAENPVYVLQACAPGK